MHIKRGVKTELTRTFNSQLRSSGQGLGLRFIALLARKTQVLLRAEGPATYQPRAKCNVALGL